MVALKYSEMLVFDDAFAMHGGYILDFSDRTFREFFIDEFGINIFVAKYAFNGTSKAKHLRALIATEDGQTVSRVARRLWEHRETIQSYREDADHGVFHHRLSGTERSSETRLANGNTLIVESIAGRVLEVAPNDDIVWEFINPVRGGEHQNRIPTIFWVHRVDPDRTSRPSSRRSWQANPANSNRVMDAISGPPCAVHRRSRPDRTPD